MPRPQGQSRRNRPIRSGNIAVVLPDAVQNEKELDKDTAERKNPAHYYSGDWFSEERLFWNLPGDLICSHWLLNSLRGDSNRRKKEGHSFYYVAAKIKRSKEM